MPARRKSVPSYQLRHIRHELETNPTLARDYPDAAGVGPVWRQDRIELLNGSVVAALGTGGRIRGRRSRQARPSLIVFDDVENNDTITSPIKRERAWRWATREVIPAGTAGTNFLSVGSALHREAVAVRLRQLSGWTGRTYPAVHRWPDWMDLWVEWERRATNLADPDRGEIARRFYEANRTAMDAGAVVYWPDRWSLVALMNRRAEIGPAAFDTEYQGVPSVEGLTEFPAAFFDRPELWFDDWPAELAYRVQALDPSKGADAKSGDFQAHVLLGLERHGTMYVEAVLARETIPLMVARAMDLAADSGFGRLDALAVENNDALGMLVSAFQDRMRERGRVVPLEGVLNTRNKVVRIRRLGLYFGRGQVRFRNTRGTRLLVDQLRDFPNAEHDDGPDALELAVRRLELLVNPH
jgi:predicted phage terminase large subunit-like protein